jgi:hypothetical protein
MTADTDPDSTDSVVIDEDQLVDPDVHDTTERDALCLECGARSREGFVLPSTPCSDASTTQTHCWREVVEEVEPE